MSDSQAYETTTVVSDGVSVTKRFEADEFPVPAIAFNVVSRRSDTVTLRLVDAVPDDVAVEDLGFHPEYGSEFWDIDDDRITFEKEIEADTEYTTVYGIRATGIEDIELFLTEPEIESVDPPQDEDDSIGGDNDAVGDGIPGESDTAPGHEDAEGGEDKGDAEDEDIETLQLKDPNGEGPPQVDGEAGDEAADGEATPGTGNVVAAMADEIRQNNVSAQDVKLLKRALDAVSGDSDSQSGIDTARINRIQGDIADLRAYTDALEEFLAENGTGDELLEEFGQRLDGFEAELDSFEAEISTATEEIGSLDGEVDSLGDGLDDVEGSVDSIEGELDELAAEIEGLREEMNEGELDERLSAVESEVQDLKEWRDQLSSVIGSGGE